MYADILSYNNWIQDISRRRYPDRFGDIDDIIFSYSVRRDNQITKILKKRKKFIITKLNTDEINIFNQKLKTLFNITLRLNKEFPTFEDFIWNLLEEEHITPESTEEFTLEDLEGKTCIELREICKENCGFRSTRDASCPRRRATRRRPPSS